LRLLQLPPAIALFRHSTLARTNALLSSPILLNLLNAGVTSVEQRSYYDDVDMKTPGMTNRGKEGHMNGGCLKLGD
jgi:hypothetical protein